MYNVNDIIIYGSQGACRIEEIVEKDFCGKKAMYYNLTLLCNENATIFVPVNNAALTSKMKRILTLDEVHEIIDNIPNEETIWIENENTRKEKYKEIILSGNRKDLVKLIKTLHLYKQEQLKKGKRLYSCDEIMLKEAEKLLYDEFALVLNIKRDAVLPFILDRINSKCE